MSVVRRFLLVATVAGIAVFATGAVAADAAKTKTSSGPGCMWIAKRVMLALLRDDIVAASDWQDMYRNFVCPAVRLADAFSCVVSEGPPESAADTRERIDACWEDPAQTQGTKASTTPGVKTPPPSKPKPPVENPAAAAPAPAAAPPAAAPAKPPAASSKSAPPVEKPSSVLPLLNKTPPYVKP